MFTPIRKVIIIFLLTVLAGYISLPQDIPLKLAFAGINLDKKIVRPDLNLSFRNVKIQKKLKLQK